MQTILRSLKTLTISFMGSLIGSGFVIILACVPYKLTHAKKPEYGHPVQRVTVEQVTCTRIHDKDRISFLISSSTQTNLTYKKVNACVEVVKKSKFILVGSKELNLTARISANFKGISCLKIDKFVISFSGEVPLDLESKTETCFTRAKQIYDYKNNSMSWV